MSSAGTKPTGRGPGAKPFSGDSAAPAGSGQGGNGPQGAPDDSPSTARKGTPVAGDKEPGHVGVSEAGTGRSAEELWTSFFRKTSPDPGTEERQQARRQRLLYDVQPAAPRIQRLDSSGATSFGGDALVQHFHVPEFAIPRSETPVAIDIPAEELQERQRRYVPPDHHDDIVRRLAHHRVQVISGPAASGRTTVAQSALTELVGQKAITELAIPVGFDFFRLNGPSTQLTVGRGHYCVIPPDVTAPSVAVLRALSSSLREIDAYLIIIGDHATLGQGAGDDDFLLSHHAPDPLDLLRGHLLTMTSEQRTKQLLDNSDVCDEARQHAIPRRIRVLAEELSWLTNEELADTRRWRGRGAKLLIETCLTVPADTSGPEFAHGVRRCALLFACVTLNQGLLSDVLEAAALLVGILRGTRSEYRPTAVEVFGADIDTLLDEVGASCIDDGHGKRLVDVPPIVVNRALPLGWRQKPDLGRHLVGWLRHLVERGVPSVSKPAAEAMGVLAAHDFPYICRTVIEPWALSTDITKNEAAGVALECAVLRSEELGSSVQYALHTWAYSGDWNARRSALFAWHTSLARQAPTHTLETLLWMGRLHQYRWSPLLSFALTSALGAFDLADVLEMLASWGSAQAHRDHAGRCFVRIVRENSAELGHLLRHRGPERDQAHRLWRAALNDAVTSDTAFRLFFEWAAAIYDGTDGDDPAVDLAKRLACRPEVRMRLAFHARIHQHLGGTVPAPIVDTLKGS